ncbi:hypothetical protein OsI_28756 [Oryza sativa Indica Group]|uniref:Uncharacterized protein n=1 Tax=Oryza sativa subsp. indica TaxID=39946 RepID=B8B9P3_ORYSI|nr:hypothetical protein OsI_28756 [Oryza sativa Indica Group]
MLRRRRQMDASSSAEVTGRCGGGGGDDGGGGGDEEIRCRRRRRRRRGDAASVSAEETRRCGVVVGSGGDVEMRRWRRQRRRGDAARRRRRWMPRRRGAPAPRPSVRGFVPRDTVKAQATTRCRRFPNCPLFFFFTSSGTRCCVSAFRSLLQCCFVAVGFLLLVDLGRKCDCLSGRCDAQGVSDRWMRCC